MLISQQKKILFVHIQKTGGVSITSLLKSEIADLQPFMGMHDHAAWAKPYLDDWADYYKFAFVRNPWARLVSWYAMMSRNQAQFPWHKRLTMRNRRRSRMHNYVEQNSNSFEEFIYNCTDVIEDRDGKKSFAYNQADYIADSSGKLLVDFVGRNERFAQDAEKICQTLGLESVSVPHHNKSPHKHYSQYYSDSTRDVVAQRFAKDIEMFDYHFDDKR